MRKYAIVIWGWVVDGRSDVFIRISRQGNTHADIPREDKLGMEKLVDELLAELRKNEEMTTTCWVLAGQLYFRGTSVEF